MRMDRILLTSLFYISNLAFTLPLWAASYQELDTGAAESLAATFGMENTFANERPGGRLQSDGLYSFAELHYTLKWPVEITLATELAQMPSRRFRFNEASLEVLGQIRPKDLNQTGVGLVGKVFQPGGEEGENIPPGYEVTGVFERDYRRWTLMINPSVSRPFQPVPEVDTAVISTLLYHLSDDFQILAAHDWSMTEDSEDHRLGPGLEYFIDGARLSGVVQTGLNSESPPLSASLLFKYEI